MRALFGQHGSGESVSLITDRETGRPRGFGFVQMARADATRAIESLNGKDVGGRPLRVNEAQERTAFGGAGGPPRGGPKSWSVSGTAPESFPSRQIRGTAFHTAARSTLPPGSD
jgi:RNA recognition motif-containing protein